MEEYIKPDFNKHVEGEEGFYELLKSIETMGEFVTLPSDLHYSRQEGEELKLVAQEQFPSISMDVLEALVHPEERVSGHKKYTLTTTPDFNELQKNLTLITEAIGNLNQLLLNNREITTKLADFSFNIVE